MNLTQHSAIQRIARLAVRGIVSLDEAQQGIRLVCSHADLPAAPESLADFTKRAAAAFESDMAPVRGAIVAALQAGDLAALKGLRALLPHLLEQVNSDSTLADLLAHQLGKELLTGLTEAPTDN
jgi:hypothetical protein